MGSVTVSLEARGASMEDAFKTLCREEEIEKGADAYSGSLHHCDLEKDVTSRFKAAKNKDKFLGELETEVPKYEAYGICIKPPVKNNNKIRSSVEAFPQKGTRKWKTVYEVQAPFEENDFVGEYKTQGEAIKKARAYTEKTKRMTIVVINKKLVSGSSQVATIKYKSSSKESYGTYLFIGCAPS